MLSLSLNLGINNVNRGMPPFKADAEMLIDGTIIEDSGDYYFKDVSGNGHDLLITGYDWADRGIKGFPYKTAATISAPVGDATLIAADVNNFLYDSGGAPNEIPVVSFFQDIDYEHKLFCKHSGQVLDLITGVELQEPYVKEIVLYDTVKSGADLVKCQVYFVVPEEDLTALVVGSGEAYTEIATAVNAAGVGDKIYVKSGNYSTGVLFNNKIVDIIGIGKAFIDPTSAAFSFNSGTNVVSISGIEIGASYSIGLYDLGNTTTTLTADRLLIKSPAFFYRGRLDTSYPNGEIVLKNCVTTSAYDCYVSRKTTFDSCKMYTFGTRQFVTLWHTDLNIKHCLLDENTGGGLISQKVDNTNVTFFDNNYYGNTLLDISNAFNLELNINYNTINLSTKPIVGKTGGTGNLVVNTNYNTFITVGIVASVINLKGILTAKFIGNTLSNSTIDYTYYFEGTNDDCSVNFSNNTLSGQSSIFRAYNCDLIHENNILSGESFRQIQTVTITDVAVSTLINNNTLSSSDASNAMIELGTEGSSVSYGKLNGAIISNNKILCPRYFGNDPTVQHGVFIFAQDCLVTKNYINGTFLAFVIKHTGVAYNTVFTYNIIEDCEAGYTIKGAPNTDVYGTTFINNSVAGAQLIQLLEDPLYVGSYSTGCKFYNNIQDNQEGTDTSFISATTNDLVDCEFDNNIYYKSNVSTLFAVVDSPSTVNFAQWQALGFDANSSQNNPILTNLIPASTSPAYGNGENLGNDYRTGLDATTDWGSDTEVPNVVTRLQGDNWDIGAYINSDTEYTYVIDENGDFVTDSEVNKTII